MILVCGLHRSGTTILARLLGSVPGWICLHEPVQSMAAFGYIVLPDGRAHPGPIEALEAELSPQTVLAKEPFSTTPGQLAADNLAFIQQHAADAIWIMRHPVEVFQSQRFWGKSWMCVESFIGCYQLFMALVGPRCVDYGRLVQDPVQELARIGVTSSGALAPITTQQFMGDWRAYSSDKVERKEPRCGVPEDDLKRIQSSDIIEAYANWSTRLGQITTGSTSPV